jgi:hypothetical protein
MDTSVGKKVQAARVRAPHFMPRWKRGEHRFDFVRRGFILRKRRNGALRLAQTLQTQRSELRQHRFFAVVRDQFGTWLCAHLTFRLLNFGS